VTDKNPRDAAAEEWFVSNLYCNTSSPRASFKAGASWAITHDPTVKGLVEALEKCTGGDLASGDGIYKAEIAREALDAYDKARGEQ
jgi:hypothetical protein